LGSRPGQDLERRHPAQGLRAEIAVDGEGGARLGEQGLHLPYALVDLAHADHGRALMGEQQAGGVAGAAPAVRPGWAGQDGQ
jgi:hypothetical protein